MLQNPCKTLGFKKNMVYKIPPGGGEVNHIQPVAYVIPGTKPQFQFSEKRAYFSVTCTFIALNAVNVRGGNAIKPFALEIGTGQNVSL